jgi:hypothetical protein
MPTAQTNTTINARRVAALFAGFDIGNASEEEAMGKFRALRHMAVEANTRIVDLLELPHVKQAIDDQLQPVRNDSPDIEEATEYITELRDELTERTRDVGDLAERLRLEKETTAALQIQLAAQPHSVRPGGLAVSASPTLGVPSWGFQAGTLLVVIALLIAALLGGHFQEGRQNNGLGNSKGTPAPGIRKDGAIHPVPKSGAVHNRVHHSGSAARTR